MPQKPHSIFIHEFKANSFPEYRDEFGDVMHGFYFTIADIDEKPLSAMIGPYTRQREAEGAAKRAFSLRDF